MLPLLTLNSRTAPCRHAGRRARVPLWPALLLLLPVALAGCSKAHGQGAAQITVAGSTSVTPFAEQLAEKFMAANPGREVNIQGIGSTAGIQATETGAADIGMSSRDLKADEEKQLVPITIALDALAIIVHPSNPVRDLSLEQVRGIFAGKITNWRQVGGKDAGIVLVNREAGSGTRGAFEELVMGTNGPPLSFRSIRQGSNGAVRAVVEGDPNAIGYMSLGIVSPEVRAVSINGVAASRDDVLARKYNLVRPFLLLARRGSTPNDLAREYVRFVLSDAGQQIISDAGLIESPHREVPWKD